MTLRESGGEEAEGQPGARDGGGKEQREKIYNGQMGDKRFGDEGGEEQRSQRELDCTVEVYMSEESEEGVTVIRQGGSFKSESCQEL